MQVPGQQNQLKKKKYGGLQTGGRQTFKGFDEANALLTQGVELLKLFPQHWLPDPGQCNKIFILKTFSSQPAKGKRNT
jgi:hypothetical protein